MATGNWFNADGLYQEFGTTKAVVDPAGEYRTTGDFREINIRLDLTTLTSTPAIVSQAVRFPTGYRIAEIDVIADTAAVGATATLDLGLQAEDRATQIDYDGLIAALPVASIDTVGETTKITKGGTGAGALIGTDTTAIGYITANWTTAAFSAGALDIRIFCYGRGTITQ